MSQPAPATAAKPDEPRFKRLTAQGRAQELVQAGLIVLSTGGITAFTIDNICRQAKASRGLIGHHFGGKDGLLAACYATAYAPVLQVLLGAGTPPDLPDLIDELFTDRQLHREGLTLWLALWGEIAVNPALQAAHQRHYQTYQAAFEQAIATFARHRGRQVQTATLAVALIALLDGLWLQLCIAPTVLTVQRARHAVAALLEPHLGPHFGPLA